MAGLPQISVADRLLVKEAEESLIILLSPVRSHLLTFAALVCLAALVTMSAFGLQIALGAGVPWWIKTYFLAGIVAMLFSCVGILYWNLFNEQRLVISPTAVTMYRRGLTFRRRSIFMRDTIEHFRLLQRWPSENFPVDFQYWNLAITPRHSGSVLLLRGLTGEQAEEVARRIRSFGVCVYPDTTKPIASPT